jgi:hypothetical protein
MSKSTIRRKRERATAASYRARHARPFRPMKLRRRRTPLARAIEASARRNAAGKAFTLHISRAVDFIQYEAPRAPLYGRRSRKW